MSVGGAFLLLLEAFGSGLAIGLGIEIDLPLVILLGAIVSAEVVALTLHEGAERVLRAPSQLRNRSQTATTWPA